MNKVLFIQGGSRLKQDSEGNWYTDANFNNDVWKRYHYYFEGELHVILRSESKVYSVNEAKKFNRVDESIIILHPVPDLMLSVSNYINIKLRKNISETIRRLIQECDHIIIRSAMTYYSCEAAKIANELNKPYLVEVTGFAFDSLWYHDIFGKMIALPVEIREKSTLRTAPYAVYVTNEALQRRYPTKGKSIGCSDVELLDADSSVLENRFVKIDGCNGKIVLGTAAFLDVAWKGQADVIKAIAALKKQGFVNIEYQLVGSGTGERLLRIADKLGVSSQIKIVGALHHDQVFHWLDSIDLYIQPSYQEGLCRAIVEAMSRACPIVATNVGGNFEIVDGAYLYPKKKYVVLASLIKKASKPDALKSQAQRNYQVSKQYSAHALNIKRNAFYKNFIFD